MRRREITVARESGWEQQRSSAAPHTIPIPVPVRTYSDEPIHNKEELKDAIFRLLENHGIEADAFLISKFGIYKLPLGWCRKCGKHYGKGVGLHQKACTGRRWFTGGKL